MNLNNHILLYVSSTNNLITIKIEHVGVGSHVFAIALNQRLESEESHFVKYNISATQAFAFGV